MFQDFDSRMHWIVDAQDRHEDADLTTEEWKDFLIVFTIDVDELLKGRIAAAKAKVQRIQGSRPVTRPAIG